jgi:hypothetical protein
MAKSARIDSPDLIKDFRNRFIVFDSECKRALDGIRSDVTRTVAWLKSEQTSYWKQQYRKREEMLRRAKEAYRQARFGNDRSCIDEQKAVKKAERMRDEAEQKIRLVRKWIQQIESKSGPMLGPCMRLSSQLADLAPKGVARLDTMIDSLDAYFRTVAGDGGGGGAESEE